MLSLFWKKPRDMVTLEESSPEPLSVPVSSLDQMGQTLQKLAMKSYLATRQRADLRKETLQHASFLLKGLTHRVAVLTTGKLTVVR